MEAECHVEYPYRPTELLRVHERFQLLEFFLQRVDMVEKESDLLVRFGFLESFPAYYFDRITHFARTKTFSMLIEFFDGTAEDIFTMSSFIASKSSDITFRGQIDQGSAIFSKSRGALVLDKGASVNFSSNTFNKLKVSSLQPRDEREKNAAFTSVELVLDACNNKRLKFANLHILTDSLKVNDLDLMIRVRAKIGNAYVFKENFTLIRHQVFSFNNPNQLKREVIIRRRTNFENVRLLEFFLQRVDMVEKESDLLVRFGFLESFPAYYFDRITHFARTKTFSMLIEFFDGTAEDIFTMSSFIASNENIVCRGRGMDCFYEANTFNKLKVSSLQSRDEREKNAAFTSVELVLDACNNKRLKFADLHILTDSLKASDLDLMIRVRAKIENAYVFKENFTLIRHQVFSFSNPNQLKREVIIRLKNERI
uniref:Uncharacterized protein n=1 Tax=Rhabditophanes sp. KR3021 TaxID=114890 RepID=A0AC35TI60_9BILA